MVGETYASQARIVVGLWNKDDGILPRVIDCLYLYLVVIRLSNRKISSYLFYLLI